MYLRGKRLQKGSTHSSSAPQQRRTDGRRHTREATETGACNYTGRSWKGRRNEKGGQFVAYFAVHKMMNNFAAWRIGAFETQRVEKSAIMFTNDRFAALARCIEAFIEAAGGNQALAAAHDFLRGFRDLSADLNTYTCLLYTSPSPRDKRQSRMPSSA